MKLYPEIRSVKKHNLTIKLIAIFSVVIETVLMLINYLINNRLHWSLLCGIGIIYIWVTTLYAIKKNTNIASHVFVQMLCISILTIGIDEILGQKGWAFNIAVPIITIIANISMFFLTLVARKRYGKYVIYHMLIFLFSMTELLIENAIHSRFILISTSITVISFGVTISLCRKEVMAEIQRRLHF